MMAEQWLCFPENILFFPVLFPFILYLKDMKASVGTVRKLLDRLIEITGYTPDYTGFRDMSEKLSLRNSDYLYKKVHSVIQGKNERTSVGLSRSHLNQLVVPLGFKSFLEFEASLSGSIHPQLSSLIGTYYCYVRANLKESVVLRSPVRIWKKENKILYELKGPSSYYRGEISFRHGCLFVLMVSPEGKTFHHVYKIGNRFEPKILQGIFSGVSTAFDPIGGRTVLVRQEGQFDVLTNRRMSVSAMKKSRQEEDRQLSVYFNAYNNNNLASNRSTTFGLDDLN